jgi:hypothetical protein
MAGARRRHCSWERGTGASRFQRSRALPLMRSQFSVFVVPGSRSHSPSRAPQGLRDPAYAATAIISLTVSCEASSRIGAAAGFERWPVRNRISSRTM